MILSLLWRILYTDTDAISIDNAFPGDTYEKLYQ